MNREEAIEVYHGLINTKIKEAFEFFAPELREINEEEIRKDLIGGLMWQRDNLKSEGPHDNNLILPGFCLTVGEHLAYLEKQKEQKPAEWSKEDKAHIVSLLERLEGMCKYGANFTRTRFDVSEDMDWLKSIRPQKNWKPSDDQMEALQHAIESCESEWVYRDYDLRSLFTDLEKLKED